MKIAIIVEGQTEKAFIPVLRSFLKTRLSGKMPKIKPFSCDGRVYKEEKLKRTVKLLLSGKDASDAVIALTDVYVGTTPPDFENAADAKRKMKEWVGKNEKFYPHAAQYDFEAWLIPFWDSLTKLAGSNANKPSEKPEDINHTRPPSKRIEEMFRAGSRGRDYIKQEAAKAIFEGKDLSVAANECPELKAFLNTILTLCGADPL